MCIRFCSMHIVNLGVDLWVAGNTARALCDPFWGEGESEVRLRVAYEAFKKWAREQKWQPLDSIPKAPVKILLRHSQPAFCNKRLRSYMHPYPELQAKAHNAAWNQFDLDLASSIEARVVIAWLASALAGFRNEVLPGDLAFAKMLSCVTLGLEEGMSGDVA